MKIAKKDSEISIRVNALMVLGAIGFPLLALLPYLVHSGQYFYITAASEAFHNCSAGYTISQTNQCLSFNQPTAQMLINIIGIISLTLFSFLAINLAKGLNRKSINSFTNLYIAIALLVTAIITPVYLVLHGLSQDRVVGVDITPGSAWIAHKEIPLGYGLMPAVFSLFTVIYLVPPFLLWFQSRYGSQNIGGLKKKELFK
jgi:hypothetical protein